MHKILLAEDDNDMRRFLVKALENAGFQVSPHDNGLSAYQRLREEPFEMLLTDIVMPEMEASSWRAAPRNSIPTSRSCSSPALPQWRSIPIPKHRSMPRCCPSRSIFANWSAK